MAAGLPSDLSSDREADAGGVPVIRVHLLGAFHVSVAGQVVSENAWRQRKAAAVVKLLALDPANRLHRERLIDLLWPELDYDAGLNNLRQALYHARRELQRGGMPAGSVLRRDGEMVVLAAGDGVWVDVQAYERAARQAWRAPSPDSIRAAIDLYAGDLLPDDVYEEWTEPLRTTLRAGYLALLTRLGELHVERGQPDRAIDAWQRLVQAEQGLESAHRSLMRAYAETGQPEMALRQYDRLATILARDLDEHPEPATRELARAIAEGQIPVVISSSASSERAHPVMNLPSPVSSLVGRTREVAQVRQLLWTERLVTLTGTGGIGKTRLAIEAARGITDEFPDGVAFVDLSSLADPVLVIPAIAQALSVREAAGEALGATLVAALRDRNLLLVLDSFERVTGAGRDIASLLEQAPSLKALVTSRVRLRLRGEREYPVPPLAIADDAEPGTVADAVALFVARSRAVQRQFQLTHEKAVTVDAICRRLAGLPLAIELAAARSRLLTPEAILSRLKRPLELLASGPLDLPARQQTIRATIQWSVDLLDAGAQQFFTRLSVFAGGWTLDAAEAVASVPVASPDTLGDLESLVDQNLITQLVHPDGEVRFGMLETIREFGMERLADSGEEATIRDRHAAWVVRLAEQAESHLEGSDQAAWLKRMEREVDNIRAALAWLREQGNAEPALRLVSVLRLTWASRGRLQEGYEQAVAVADLPHSAFYPALRADALIAASFLARAAGDFERAYDATRASLAISHQIRDRKRAADGLVNLGHIALQRGKIDDARALLQRSLTTNRELRNEQGIADTLGFLALTDIQTGDLDTAAQRLEQCVAIWDGLDDLQGVAWARGQLGLVRLEQAEYHAAWDNLMASLVISEALDFRSEIYPVFDGLARLASNYGQWDLAAQLAAASATVREESGIRLSPAEQARVDQLHGELLTLLGHAALNDIWSQRRGWTLTVMTGRIRETLAPLLAVLSSNGSPVMQPGGHAHPPVREDEPTD